MNWARGTFRVWLILSFTWLAVVCAVGQIWQPIGGLIALYTPPAWSEASIIQAPAAQETSTSAETSPPWVKYQLQQEALKAASWRWLATIAGFGLVPPFILLLFGLSAFWAVRGFRQT